jgi:hypothetical protein
MGLFLYLNINNLLKSNIFISYKDGKITLEKKKKYPKQKKIVRMFLKKKKIFLIKLIPL